MFTTTTNNQQPLAHKIDINHIEVALVETVERVKQGDGRKWWSRRRRKKREKRWKKGGI